LFYSIGPGQNGLSESIFSSIFLFLLAMLAKEGRHYTQHNSIQHKYTQHNDIQHNDPQHNDPQHDDPQHNDPQHDDRQQNNK
jgi:hypothetical protein